MVQTDHKPLEIIIRKPMSKASPRLQRMLLQLQRYTLKVLYIPGKDMHLADTLSHAPQEAPPPNDNLSEEAEIMVHAFVAQLPATDARLKEISKASADDPEICELSRVVHEGWPDSRSDVRSTIKQYWNFRDEIHEAEGIFFKGEKIIVPQCLRQDMLFRIHEGHLGEEKSKERARAVLFWPGMTKDIEDTVSKCATCLRFRRSNQKEPLIPHMVPERPWQKVGADIMTFKHRDYLVVVDYYSKYVELQLLSEKTAKAIVTAMKSIYARHGIPQEVMSDNMPFASREFKDFAAEWGIVTTTSSPTYPQSNGLSERSIQTVKQLLRKAEYEGKDVYLALLELRSAPIAGMEQSPAELLMGRMLRTKLPASPMLLKPRMHDNVRTQLCQRQAVQKYYYDRSSKPMRELVPGDTVRIKRGDVWEPAFVQDRHEAPRSYVVTSAEGTTYRRNRKDLIPTKEPPPVFILPEPDLDSVAPLPQPTQAPVQCDIPTAGVPSTPTTPASLTVPRSALVSPSAGSPRTSRGRSVKLPDQVQVECVVEEFPVLLSCVKVFYMTIQFIQ